ncbi:cytochrome P450 [Nocardioides sp. AN3]
MTSNDLDTVDESFWAYPEEFFRASQAGCPVAKLPGESGYILTRYDDVRAASVRVKDFSSHRPIFGEGDPELEAIAATGYPEVATITSSDPPEHTRFRKLVYRAFTPEVVNGLAPNIRAIADDLLQTVATAGRMDFVNQFAELMPMYVMADALGISRADRSKFKVWSDNIVLTIAGYMVLTPELKRECKLSYVEFQHYFAEIIEERRANPGDDMISQLVLASIDGERPLSVPEILDIIRIFLVAGNDTTSNLLAGGLLALLDNPSQLAEVQANRDLIPNMVEEALRFVSPSRWTTRTVRSEGADIAGCPVTGGERLRLGWGPANRDATRFPDPDTFDIHRDASAHMAFGHGVHFCIGKDLARAEAHIAFNALFDTFTDFELTVPRSAVRPLPVPAVNRINQLPIRFRTKDVAR